MKKIALVLLACAPVFCSAAGKSASATMQVSFTVTEACTVQSEGTAAQVSCAHETPYLIQAKAGTAAQPATAQPAPLTTPAANREPTVVYF
ncbi:hypothetical protein [Pseudoduganella lutea]|uniref:Uncharacterized protein n=1 Tax=Pseudoduganella lutea TaxID=321985 RepID=A0A4P6L3R0_9BURK|nr:hypothetical protein [Pseudoduganella lutea]QBE66149.1 hypothetical protein EWM63_26810 [Pseudoduganella lutea]